MDEKHAFLVAVIVMLCVAWAITILAYASVDNENDYIKQELGIDNVTVGEGMHFTQESWVIRIAKDKGTCEIKLANTTAG